MENVFRLSEYRKRREAASEAEPAPAGPQYHCTRCDAGEFRLLATGRILCARCGARMRNISVSA